ncbi:hypothetical protein A2W14_02250 [Candidatus Gottesmanbacteria bacterium RBG_16_37_8]|uniref:Polysaccharide biosynthesis protein C-terminal domain-containing protein n=1 Tax=Candidatus Gottesmanbacteria bacterium RBG_16_37_8 TaxID=1798371 RepID=A0A1F5YRX1_9BACT|nr:MAG: hypothetical protein A2W14_02250 [Candidatus Gottesmanbacteria bacterium RBG_16_37_8]
MINRIIKLILSKLAQNTYILIGGSVLEAIFSLFFIIITFRLLTVSQFGLFSVIVNFGQIVFTLTDFGIGRTMFNFIPYYHNSGDKKQAKQMMTVAIILRGVISLIVFTAMVLGAKFIARLVFKETTIASAYLSALTIIGFSLTSFITTALQTYEKFWQSAVVNISYAGIRLVMAIIFLAGAWQYNAASATLITVFACLFSFILGAVLLNLRDKIVLPNKKIFATFISFNNWLAVSRVFNGVAGRLDIQLLYYFAGPTATAIYSLAIRFTGYFITLANAFLTVIIPRLAIKQTRKELNSFVKKIGIAMGGLSIILILAAVVSRLLIPAVFGKNALAAIPVFQLLAIAHIPIIANLILSAILIYTLKIPEVFGKISILNFILVFILNLILIPKLNYFAPVIVLFSAGLILLVIYAVIIGKKFKELKIV